MKRSKAKKVLSLALSGCMMMGMIGCGAEEKENNAEQPISEAYEEEEKSLEDYEKAESFHYYAIAAGISDEEFNDLDIAKTIQEYTGYLSLIHI